MSLGYPKNSAVFQEDDSGFFRWLDGHPDGYFINAERNPKPSYLVLHRPSCPHFDRSPDVNWTKNYIKICSAARSDLLEWAACEVGGDATLCTRCFG
jgi:hypothetical protein